MTRWLLGYAGVELPPTVYPAAGPGIRGKLRRLGHAQSWRDLLHVLVAFMLSTVTFSIAVTWVVRWARRIDLLVLEPVAAGEQQGLPYLLGFPGRFADVTFNSILGAS